MNKILTKNEITKFKEDGAIFLKNKFNIHWINKLKTGIEKDISNPICNLDLALGFYHLIRSTHYVALSKPGQIFSIMIRV